MRIGLKAVVAALALGGMLAGCAPEKSGAIAPVKTDAKQLDARIEKLSTQPFKLKADKAADIPGLVAALPKAVAVTYGKLDFDPASGATILHDLKVTPSDAPDIGVSVAEVKLWGLDTDFAKARLAGQRLAETAPLARRVEAKTIAVFGLDKLMGPVAQASSDAAVAAAEKLAPGAAGIDQVKGMEITTYAIAMNSLVINDLRLRPWELAKKALPEDNTWAKVLPPLQVMAAYSRAVALDTASADGLKFEIGYRQGEENMAMAMGANRFAYRGLRGGDADFGLLKGLTYDLNMTVPEQRLGKPMPIKMTGAIALYSIENLRLDKLYGYLARGVMPPRTDTNLVSGGVWRFENQSYSFNGHPVFAAKSGVTDLGSFYWLIPTHLRFEAKEATYIIAGMIAWADEMARIETPDAAPLVDARVIDALKAHKLDEAKMDVSATLDWKPDTGASHVDFAWSLASYGAFDFKTDFGLPDFKSVSDLAPTFETANQKGLSALFEKATTLTSAEATLTDKGGMEEGFGLAIDIAKALPDEPDLAFLRNATTASLRQTASSAIYVAADEVAKENGPSIREMLRGFAALIDKGGALKVSVKPDKPVALSTLGQAGQTPTQVSDLLHLKVVSTPPPGSAKPQSRPKP